MYPAFVNCTTIDWFSEWPNDALLEVAEKYLEPMELGDDEVIENFTINNKCFLSAVFSATTTLCLYVFLWPSFIVNDCRLFRQKKIWQKYLSTPIDLL